MLVHACLAGAVLVHAGAGANDHYDLLVKANWFLRHNNIRYILFEN